MADAARPRMSREEFLAWDEKQPDRYAFIDGEIHAMTGGTRDHTEISHNIVAALKRALAGTPCRALGEGLKIDADTDLTYPNVVVTREPLGPRSVFVSQPRLIVDVLSPSTEARDRGERSMAYQRLPSLEYYVLVSQAVPRVEIFTRAANGWGYAATTDLHAKVAFPALGVTLPLSTIYQGCFTVDPGAEAAV